MPIHKPHRQEKKKKKWKNLLFLNRKNHWRINTQRGCPQETNTQAEFWQKAQQRGTILECMGFFKIWFWLTSMGRAHDILSYVGFYHGSHSFVHLHNLTCLFWQWHKIVHKTQSQRRVRVAQPMAPREVVFWKGNWFKKLPDPKFQAWVRLSACVWLWDGVCPCCHLLKGLSHRVLFVRTNRPATEDGRRELIPQTCSDGLSSKKHGLDHLPNPIQPQTPDTPPPSTQLSKQDRACPVIFTQNITSAGFAQIHCGGMVEHASTNALRPLSEGAGLQHRQARTPHVRFAQQPLNSPDSENNALQTCELICSRQPAEVKGKLMEKLPSPFPSVYVV